LSYTISLALFSIIGSIQWMTYITQITLKKRNRERNVCCRYLSPPPSWPRGRLTRCHIWRPPCMVIGEWWWKVVWVWSGS
jgi:hypothetical protein